MNKRQFPHPAAIYLLLLLLVVIASWIGSVLEMRGQTSYSLLTIRSVFSESGLRWMVLNASVTLSHAPIGNAIMLLMTVGVLKSSGLWGAFHRLGHLSPRERTSLVVAAVSLMLLVLLFVFGAVSGSRLTTGVASGIAGSPVGRGLVFLVMITAAVPSVAYGLAGGVFQTTHDCVEAFACMIRPMAHLFICMLVASQLLETLSFTRLDQVLGLGPSLMRVLAFVLYWLPLPIIMRRNQKTQPNI